MRIALLIVVGLIAFMAFGAWGQGTFDHALASYGLSAKPCARNIFGTVYCGDEIKAYRTNLRRLRHRASR